MDNLACAIVASILGRRTLRVTHSPCTEELRNHVPACTGITYRGTPESVTDMIRNRVPTWTRLRKSQLLVATTSEFFETRSDGTCKGATEMSSFFILDGAQGVAQQLPSVGIDLEGVVGPLLQIEPPLVLCSVGKLN